MKSRRSFLIQGSLATTALFALKPLTTFARAASTFSGAGTIHGNLVILHTANLNPSRDYQVIQYINTIKKNKTNAILLKAGQDIQDETGQLTYDASFQGGNLHSAITGDYKIINKGMLRTGIISAKPEERDIIERINTLSTYLKKEKNCTIVVCLSQIGFKNKNAPDDITLANKSTHLDIIISGHAENFPINPFIALNSNGGEVIIHSAAGNAAAFGKIEIDFNGHGQKKHISFVNTISDNTAANRSMSAA